MKVPILCMMSAYSMLYGPHKIENLLDEAVRRGFSTVAITDINNVYGLHKFIDECKKRNITPIPGTLFKLKGEEAVVLARTKKGFSSICRMITAINDDTDLALSELLQKDNEGITVLAFSPSLLRKDTPFELYAAMTTPFDSIHKAARELGIPVAAIPRSVFLKRTGRCVHRLLRAIDTNRNYGDIQDEELEDETSLFPFCNDFKVFDEMCPGSVKNSVKIADSCSFHSLFTGFIFPSYNGMNDLEAAVELRKRTFEGASRRFEIIDEKVSKRLDHELQIINGMGYAPYFLVVADITALSSGTCGRGSGAASAVAYSLGITNVDPVKHNLYFERFLNYERKDPPDIDLDFAWDERNELIETVMKKFGEKRSAMVCEHIRFRRRSALREAARAFGIPEYETSDKTDREGKIWKRIERAAELITGLPRNISVHSGGVVITPDDISNYVPVETASGGMRIISWEKDGTEAAGLVKIDLLGNRSLAVIRDAVDDLKNYDIHVDRTAWDPHNDKKTQKLLASGNSMGVFYVESPAMRQLQNKTKRGDFDHLVIHSSIIRPAANSYINQYVERLNGAKYEPLHPDLDKMFKETYGIMCYQEDVSRTAITLAGFSIGKADKLRKIISKKDKTVLDKYRHDFLAGCIRKNVERTTAEEMWNMIASFSGYSFCKPHSASYALVSFQSAWLKAHYPAQFMAAVISNNGGFYSTQSYISEARRMGLKVLPPDINKSLFNFVSSGMNSIRCGFQTIRNLSYKAMEDIIRDRDENGDFKSLAGFIKRIHLKESDITALVSAGVFDEITNYSARSSQLTELLLNKPAKHDTKGLFEDSSSTENPLIKEREPLKVILRTQQQTLGFLTDYHPLVLFQKEIKKVKTVKAHQLLELIGRTVTISGWPVAMKHVPTKNRELMSFNTFEDDTALFETVIFPKVFAKYRHLLNMETPLFVTGKVENDHGAIQLNVQSVRRI